jgi:hypothetical protein
MQIDPKPASSALTPDGAGDCKVVENLAVT